MRQASEDVRPAVHQHDRGGRGGRHPRHDSQAARDLHREGGQADGPGEVGDDLPGRRHRHRRRSSSASFCGRSSRPSRTLFAGLGADLPLPTRVVIGSATTWSRYFPFLLVGRRRASAGLPHATTRPTTAGASSTRIDAEDAGPRQHHAQDRGGAVLPHAVDADQLGRADSRRPRDHREDRRQRDHRGRDHGRRARASSAARRSAAPLKETDVFPADGRRR